MTDLSDYEATLDHLDGSIYLKGAEVVFAFSHEFRIPLSRCSTLEQIFESAREVELRLLREPDLNLRYCVTRFLKLIGAARVRMDADKFYNLHGILVIHDVAGLAECEQLSGEKQLRFENGKGEYAGYHFIALRRSLNADGTLFDGPVRINRSMQGHHPHQQDAEITALELTATARHLVFSIPLNTSWQSACKARSDFWHGLTTTRMAVRHNWSEEELLRVVDEIRTMFAGLQFTFTRLN
jgi:hypothetical protein